MSIARSFVNLENNTKELTQDEIHIAKGCVPELVKQKLKCNLSRRFQTALKELFRNPNIHKKREKIECDCNYEQSGI